MKIKLSILLLCFAKLMMSAEANPQPDVPAGNQQQAQLLVTVQSWGEPGGVNAWVDGLVRADQEAQRQQRAQDVAAAGAILPQVFGIRGAYQAVYSAVGTLSDSLRTGIVKSFSRIYHIGKYPLMGLGAASALSSSGNSGFYILLGTGVAAGAFLGSRDYQRAQALEAQTQRLAVMNQGLQTMSMPLATAINTSAQIRLIHAAIRNGGAQLQADIARQGQETAAVVDARLSATGAALLAFFQEQARRQDQANVALADGIQGIRSQLSTLGAGQQLTLPSTVPAARRPSVIQGDQQTASLALTANSSLMDSLVIVGSDGTTYSLGPVSEQ